MDMWNWLNDCYRDGDLTVDFMENVLSDENKAELLFKEYMDSISTEEWVEECQHQVSSFYKYIVEKEKYLQDQDSSHKILSKRLGDSKSTL